MGTRSLLLTYFCSCIERVGCVGCLVRVLGWRNKISDVSKQKHVLKEFCFLKLKMNASFLLPFSSFRSYSPILVEPNQPDHIRSRWSESATNQPKQVNPWSLNSNYCKTKPWLSLKKPHFNALHPICSMKCLCFVFLLKLAGLSRQDFFWTFHSSSSLLF